MIEGNVNHTRKKVKGSLENIHQEARIDQDRCEIQGYKQAESDGVAATVSTTLRKLEI